MSDPDLFSNRGEAERQSLAPLADRMRPHTLDELVGQEALVGEGTLLRRAIEHDRVTSMILWGPPGSGKTTLARVIAGATGRRFVTVSAVMSGVADLRRVIAEARDALKFERRGTILFIDEIHHFNKAQQDALLPHVESGVIALIGATTENPSFEVNSALLSRARTFVLQPLSQDDIRALLYRAVESPEGLAALHVELAPDAAAEIARTSGGDARAAYNVLELAATTAPYEDGRRRVDVTTVRAAQQRRTLGHDKSGEEHYNLLSALHKSLRGSDPQAALYWIARMLEAGESPLTIARRMVRFASEDVGLADPQALVQAMAARDAVHFLGMPEGDAALAQAAVYLATAPKSNALDIAMAAARKDVNEHGALPVPIHLRNAPTRLMKELGYGRDYAYDHDQPGNVSAQTLRPPAIDDHDYYTPKTMGFEKSVAERIAFWEQRRRQAREGRNGEGAAGAE